MSSLTVPIPPDLRPACRAENTVYGTVPQATVYGFATLDINGRVADRAVVGALRWQPGIRLSLRERRGLLIVHAEPDVVFRLSAAGYLLLPATARRWCRLQPGDRVLLAADPAEGRLVVHPPAALDAMVTQAHLAAFDGGAS